MLGRDDAMREAERLLDLAAEAVDQRVDVGVVPKMDVRDIVTVAVGWLLLADRLETGGVQDD